MDILSFLIFLVVIVVIFWVVRQLPEPFRMWVGIIAGVLIVVLLLNYIGAFSDLGSIRLRR